MSTCNLQRARSRPVAPEQAHARHKVPPRADASGQEGPQPWAEVPNMATPIMSSFASFASFGGP
jgi:hypothetical protein